ncbi:TIGR01621 family pseudouridine synthase [Chitinimonas sp. BJYL2]|uniref:TIGR01621 family pseudouridine synthase n=1 Tax=Chitinimonas sp. BJYL2 TaxID=2976696 RepID=UPI0022B3468E|nr:TIGR01621 family pseudouridine synthase [Chitinimonas sp. BJYL2]
MMDILLNHPRFIVINKPAGQGFHREAAAPGVLALLREQTGLTDLHGVHRLDTLTSGLLLFAKGGDTAATFGQLFATRRMDKCYLAVSASKPTKKQGLISGDMVRSRNGSWRLAPTREDPALTRFFSTGVGNGRRLFLLRPLTGRTHQLRVALKSLGSPILGDARYGGEAADRGYLHAYALRFTLEDETFSLCCPPTSGTEWGALPTEWHMPWDLPWPGGKPASAVVE